MFAELFGLRSTHRAHVRARTAIDASFRIDDIDAVTLRNSGNGASIGARAAADASVVNFVSHESHLPLLRTHVPARSSFGLIPV